MFTITRILIKHTDFQLSHTIHKCQTVALQSLASAFAPVTQLNCCMYSCISLALTLALLINLFIWVFSPVHAGLLIAWPFATFVCLHLYSFFCESWQLVLHLDFLELFGVVSLHPHWSCISLNYIRISMIIINHGSWVVGGIRWPMERRENRHVWTVSASCPGSCTWATPLGPDSKLCPFVVVVFFLGQKKFIIL